MSSTATTTMATQNPERGGAIPAMWVPCLVFAHMFAAFFMLKMIQVAYPSTWAKIKRRALCRGAPPHEGQALTAGAVAAAGGRSGRLRGTKTLPAATSLSKDVSTDQDQLAADRDCELGGAEGQDGSVLSDGSEEMIDKLISHVHPMLMEWEEIGCSYKTSHGMRVVLQGIWGRAEPGEMVALMGPSGAGKSTLMDILAGRKSVGHLTGQVLVNKHRRRKDHFRKRTAYVPQDDNFLPTMTVSETCSFYATMLLPNTTTKAQRQERITEVLAAMGLSHTVDTLVGGHLPGGLVLRGLSGGERKRLSIAQGIMSTPSILFLDEPTSGLDSYAALSVMSYMRGMATKGSQTVISSIHQPRAAIWALFDKAVLLSKGRMMYSGMRDGMVPWFVDHCHYTYDPGMHGLASDWVMDLVNVGFTKPESLFGKMMNTEEELTTAADAFTEQYLLDSAVDDTKVSLCGHQGQLPASRRALDTVKDEDDDTEHTITVNGADTTTPTSRDQEDAASTVGTSPSVKPQRRRSWFGGRSREEEEAVMQRHQSASWFTQCRVLMWREFMSVTRNPADVAGRCLIFTYLAMFVGLIFYGLPDNIDALRARMNVLFVEPVILLLLPYVYMSLFTADKEYFVQDASAKLYRTSAYYVAKQLAVAPFAVLNCLLYTFILYGLAGLRHDPASVGMNALMSVLMYLIALQVLTFTAMVMPNQDLAFMGAIVWTAINLLMDNHSMRFVDIGVPWFSQLRYLSAMGFAFDGYGQAEFSGVTYSCGSGLAPSIVSVLPDFLPNTPIIRSDRAISMFQNPSPDCTITLNVILDYFSLHRPFWATCVILVGYLAVLHAATFGGLMHLAKKEKR